VNSVRRFQAVARLGIFSECLIQIGADRNNGPNEY
jgi:hypothetical protein